MVVNPSRNEIKSSALRFADQMNAYFVSGSQPDEKMEELIRERLMKRNKKIGALKLFFENEIDKLVEEILHTKNA